MVGAVKVKFDLLKAGHCVHPECMAMRGGRWNAVEFPALVGLIEHPVLGCMLYDTGYSRHFMEATRGFPECLYRMATPPVLPPEEELLVQLEQRNIRAEEIGTILISHFHGDHVAGLRDFPKAGFVATKEEYQEMAGKGRAARLRSAFLKDLLPGDFEERVRYAEDADSINPELHGFSEGYDLFGDGSLVGVPLPGHVRSQLGVTLTDHLERRVFLIGDACWKMEGLSKRRMPSPVAGLLFADSRRYAETFGKLANLHERDVELKIVPSHCLTTWERDGNTKHVRHG